MTEYTLILHPHEARGLLDKGEMLIVRPMKPQPPDGWGGSSAIYALKKSAPFQPGDRLIGKETWALVDWFNGDEICTKVLYKADDPGSMEWRPEEGDRWLSPILMPRELSRFYLEVTAEPFCKQVQEMTPEDAGMAGIRIEWSDEDGSPIYGSGGHLGFGWKDQSYSPLGAYVYLHNSIYARRGLGWDANPHVFGAYMRRMTP